MSESSWRGIIFPHLIKSSRSSTERGVSMDPITTTTQAWRAAIPQAPVPAAEAPSAAAVPVSSSSRWPDLRGLSGGGSGALGCAAGGVAVFVFVFLLMALMRPPMALRRREPGCVDPERLCMASTCGWALVAGVAAGSLAYFA